MNLTSEEIANMGDSEDHVEQTNLKVRKRFGTQPWMNTKYITNNFENRHQTQQKVLQEQQKQLKEQQRIIEELQFAQNQNKLHEQLEKQQTILEHLARNITPRSDDPVPKQQISGTQQQQNSKQLNQTKQSNTTTSKVNEQASKKTNLKPYSVAMDTSRTTSTAVTSRTDSTTKSSTKYLQVLKSK